MLHCADKMLTEFTSNLSDPMIRIDGCLDFTQDWQYITEDERARLLSPSIELAPIG
jgi:hypothetical protein